MAYNNSYGNGGNGGGKKAFDNTNRGTLGKNKKKDKSDPSHEKKPDYSGKINIEGKDYWLSGWLREGQDGEKFFSLSVQPQEENRDTRGNAGGGNRGRDSDIPF
jgi:hypothetical protein